MSRIEEQFLELLKRTERFSERYQQMQRKLKMLEAENEMLKEELENQIDDLEIMSDKYEKLRVAKSFDELGENPVKVRAKVNELIRGIDKCIERLNK